MKRVLFMAMIFPVWLNIAHSSPKLDDDMKTFDDKMFERLERAVIIHESRCDTFAIGSNMDCGLYQITPVLLQDYMNKTGKKYELGDLFNPEVGSEIFNYYSRGLSYEQAARRWNGGPKGMRKQSTIKYWNKVKVLL